MADAVTYWCHMARLFMALYASGPAEMSYLENIRSTYARKRRFAVRAKARMIVIFDRILCGEDERNG